MRAKGDELSLVACGGPSYLHNECVQGMVMDTHTHTHTHTHTQGGGGRKRKKRRKRRRKRPDSVK